ncbi:Hypothetical protein HVR_LOCUS628 [uncultured virus]|nr:Hypothetical protein HVR_LOCUS628 [uncultured virus]
MALSFEERYKRLECLGSGMKGITYLVYDKIENRDVVAKLAKYDDNVEGFYSIIHSIPLKCFVKPLNWFYPKHYPQGYDKPPSCEDEDSDYEPEEGWMIYTMPIYKEFKNNFEPELRLKYLTDIFHEYSLLQEKFGFCQGGDVGGNLLFGELNDHSGVGIVIIDLDDCNLEEDTDIQYNDSISFVNGFMWTNNNKELSDLLYKLQSLHSSDWNL